MSHGPRGRPGIAEPARGHAIWALFFGVLALMVLVVAAINWRHWLAPLLPAHTQVRPFAAGPGDHERAHFTLCNRRSHIDCVVDGDTIHYHGDKIRLADINAPEISEPNCDSELDLGEKAADRLLALLNQGPFSLVPLPDRDTDVYGRQLRTIMRGGHSLGGVLVGEGLAERWVGYRRDWCS